MNEHSFMSNTRLIQKRKRKFSDKNIYISLCQFSKRYFSGKNICLLSISIIVENFELFTILMEIFFFRFYISHLTLFYLLFLFFMYFYVWHMLLLVLHVHIILSINPFTMKSAKALWATWLGHQYIYTYICRATANSIWVYWILP